MPIHAIHIPGRAVNGYRRPPGTSRLNYDSAQAVGLVRRWRLDERGVGEQLTRAIPTNTGLSLVGHPALGPCWYSGSGTTSRLALPATLTVPYPLSISMWWQRINQSAGFGVTTSGTGGADGARGEQGGTNLGYTAGGNNSISYAVSTTQAQHVLWTVAGTTITIYVDGISRGQITDSLPATHLIDMLFNYYASPSFAQLGWMADLRIYNYALSAGLAWAMYEPSTRWELDWQPGRKLYVEVGSGVPTPSVGVLTMAGIAPSLGFTIHMPDEL